MSSITSFEQLSRFLREGRYTDDQIIEMYGQDSLMRVREYEQKQQSHYQSPGYV
jgi:hypothetical protein